MMLFSTWIAESTVPAGDCYRYAYQLFRRLADNGEDAALVHATVTQPVTGKEFPHAWVVWNGDVYDWQSSGKRSSRKEFKALWKPAKRHHVFVV